MTERVEGDTFADETVRLDGRGFVSCTFDGCRVVYAGGPTEIVGCTFTDCVWQFDGRAANAVALLGGLGAPAEARIQEVTIRTSSDEADEGRSQTTREAPEAEARQPTRPGRWIFVSGDLAWIAIAAGVVLVTVVLGRAGG